MKETCGKCHAEVTVRHLNSLHSTLEGHRLALVDSMGKEKGEAQFTQCTGCHATCTSCHMKQPDKFNRLVSQTESHGFTKQPASYVCKVCHGQTSETYLGDPANPQHKPSMMATAGIECTDCHSEKEIHGDGKRPNFIADTRKPSCEGCHLQPNAVKFAGVSSVPPQFDPREYAHQAHGDDVDCIACHTQWYTNCWDCHRGDAQKQDNKLYLAVNPTTKKVQTAVHSPLNAELGGADPAIGGWAIKARHSWGQARPCDECHTNSDAYIDNFLRNGKFVGVWAKERRNAGFVDEKLVARITVDAQKLALTAHRDINCVGCHNNTGDETCTKCHVSTTNVDRSRTAFTATQVLLASSRALIIEARALNVDATGWDKQRADLEEAYWQTTNLFHSNPNLAQKQIQNLNAVAKQLVGESENAIANARLHNKLLVASVPFVFGAMIAAGAGMLLMRSKKNDLQE
ncbi:MAG: hypothetical protein HY868_20790 [Chloroflexi bacterium]|nr:hypothetical protein [Chloroflexota bacterium]